MKNSIKPNILIVDDIEENLTLIEDLLDSFDVNLITALSGAEALEKIQDTEIILALIDVKMPEMNGFDLAQLMHENAGAELIPVIFVTAFARDQFEIEKYYSAGVVDYITKPFSNHIIQSKVKVFLELHRQKLQIRNQNAEMELIVNELRESEKMYRTLLNASPEGIIIMDMTGHITEISNITLEIFGYENKQEFLGKQLIHFLPAEEQHKLNDILTRTQLEGLVQNVEFVLKNKNQSQFVCELSTTLIQETDGKPKAYMAIIRDISQRKKMEQQLIRTERMVSLGKMASGMAHEINQPLLSITLSIENMLHKIQKANAVDDIYLKAKSEKIFENIQRISYIIDHVRAFSRDHDDYILTSFNINESIKNAISMISEQFKHHGIKLTVKLDKSVHPISGNTYKFEQVILNLLNNAKDALGEKSKQTNEDFKKTIRIRTYYDDTTNFVEIKDNGIGIKAEDIDRIMFPFYTTKEVGKGTGLGLSISFSIIKELNGNIDIESHLLSGTTFRIAIPKPVPKDKLQN